MYEAHEPRPKITTGVHEPNLRLCETNLSELDVRVAAEFAQQLGGIHRLESALEALERLQRQS